MPRQKGTKNRIYTPEIKKQVIDFLEINGATETEKHFNISNSVFYKWQRIYLEYGMEGLSEERRGRNKDGKPKGRKPNLDKKVEEDLIAKVQRLQMENAYLKKLAALIQEEERKQKKSK